MNVIRENCNPIISPKDIRPLNGDFEVVGVFNPGVTVYNGKTVLVLRVAQRPIDLNDGMFRVPVFDEVTKQIKIKQFDKSDKSIDFSDSRIIKMGKNQRYLTSYSSFVIATSEDGVNFDIEQDNRIMPDNIYEAFGIEDARVVKIDGEYFINYSAASELGIITSLIKTKDFKSYERMGNIMCPDNKDVSIFPEKINGFYYSLHRPSTSEFGRPEIWVAKADNLMCWGDHKNVLKTRAGQWDGARIGSSSIPIKTEKGWLVIYHGADIKNRYFLGACLLDLNDPSKLIARSEQPFMSPEKEYELNGFFGNVIFSCGCVENGDDINIYYGAADEFVCKATVSKKDLLNSLANV